MPELISEGLEIQVESDGPSTLAATDTHSVLLLADADYEYRLYGIVVHGSTAAADTEVSLSLTFGSHTFTHYLTVDASAIAGNTWVFAPPAGCYLSAGYNQNLVVTLSQSGGQNWGNVSIDVFYQKYRTPTTGM